MRKSSSLGGGASRPRESLSRLPEAGSEIMGTMYAVSGGGIWRTGGEQALSLTLRAFQAIAPGYSRWSLSMGLMGHLRRCVWKHRFCTDLQEGGPAEKQKLTVIEK